MALDPAERDGEQAGADAKKGPDSQDSMGIGGGTGKTGKDEEGILAVSENSDIAKRVNGVALEENLQAEADSKDLAEIVSAGAKSGAKVNALIREENHDTRASGARIRRSGAVCVTNHRTGVERQEISQVRGPSINRRRGSLVPGALRLIEKGVGKFSNTVRAPGGAAIGGSMTSRATEAPDSQVEGENGSDIGLMWRGVLKEEKGMAKSEGGGVGDRTTRKKKGTGLVNNRAGTINMGDGVLISGTIEASGDILKGNLVLMTHTPKGGKSVVDQSDVVENNGGGETFALAEGRGNKGKASGGRIRSERRNNRTRRRRDGGRVEEAGNLTGGVSEGVVVEGVVHNGLVDGGAGSMRERREGTVGEVAAIPKVNRSSVTMIRDETAVLHADEGKGVEIGDGVDKR